MSKSDRKIYVTKPSMPPLEEYLPFLKKIWGTCNLTNGGEFHQQLEKDLCSYLGVDHISLFANGTIALVTALQALEIEGEVITTPYSFVATSHSLLWNGLKPIFVDIDSKTFNIDPKKIEEAVTAKTKAILAVHCYGFPCDTKSIQAIAEKHKLKVIYDAAHAFAVADSQGSVLQHGDLSILSFHATKVFQVFEGGAIISRSLEMKQKIDQLKNFGFVDEVTVSLPGINGKMSELNASFGLLQLKYVDEQISKRRLIDERYRNCLNGVEGLICPPLIAGVKSNFSYFPLLITDQFFRSRDSLFNHLRSSDVIARRYFYPLISNFSMYSEFDSASRMHLPNANKIADQVLCLPIYPELSFSDVDRICSLILGE
jgi:dTDP-4-amino-4,6-dideoxygalactose transaminase